MWLVRYWLYVGCTYVEGWVRSRLYLQEILVLGFGLRAEIRVEDFWLPGLETG